MGRLRCCHQNAARQRAVAQLLRDVVGDLRHETTRGSKRARRLAGFMAVSWDLMAVSWDLMAVSWDLLAVSWDLPSGKHTKRLWNITIFG